MSFNCDLTFNNSSVLGHEKQGKDKGAKNVLVMSSKAKGIDRLTGRARRSVTAKPQLHQCRTHNSMMLLLIQPFRMALTTASALTTATMANEICKVNVGILIVFRRHGGCHEAWFRSCGSWLNNPEGLILIPLHTTALVGEEAFRLCCYTSIAYYLKKPQTWKWGSIGYSLSLSFGFSL